MISLKVEEGKLLLFYESEGWNNARWLDDKLQRDGKVTLRRTFTFQKDALYPQPEGEGNNLRIFIMGEVDGRYIRINKDVLNLQHDLLIDSAISLDVKLFVAHRDISVFRKIDQLIDEPIVVGGNIDSAIPYADFAQLLENFPTSTELTHYAGARIGRVLKDYFGTMSDAEGQLNRYLNRKKKLPLASRPSIVANFELQKFEYVHAELSTMLQQADSYSEKNWQTKVLDLLLFVFPKYVAVLENVHVKDFYTNTSKTTDRYIDLMLVDANGNIDIIEVKKPFANALVSHHTYRDNHTPKKELAGAVMQAEKYLFHLNKWGHAGEQAIYKKHKDELPADIELKITTPKAMVLLGRDNDFAGQQRFDFEIIRRKYANMLDIMTYDDLLRRVQNIIEMMHRKMKNGGTK